MRRLLWCVTGILVAGMLAGCGSQPKTLQETLPATFTGTLPCADCPGIDYTLELHADGSYYRRMSYRERGSFDDVGRWLPSSDRTRLATRGAGGDFEQFVIVDADRLQRLDQGGLPIVSAHDYSLVRATAAPLEPRLAMRGAYRYMADAAVFTECASGLLLPVVPGPAAAQLESAYLGGRGAPGEPAMVALEGRIAEQVVMEGAPRPALEVVKFDRLLAEAECPPPFAPLPLAGTQWTVVQLGGQAVTDEEGARAPSLSFDEAAGSIAGFTGCNRLVGAYKADGTTLAFGKLAATRMACPGASILELTFTDALKEVARWNILGDRLELYDAGGALLVRLQGAAGS
jgi:copper homeostasis protein (lipoprotein)